MSEVRLNNAPLKEVIFELHWGLDFIHEQNVFVDIGFEDALFHFRIIVIISMCVRCISQEKGTLQT
ncbi:MAG: hypothetical protein IPG79_18680 [Saprospiraceae bacterium]|nr:hypothetical protein [Saprospiraceae bacterium]